MRFCAYHWDTLRDKITERGMGDLIAPDGTVAVDQELDQLRRDGEHTPVNYDPLMAAHWAVTNNALETISLGIAHEISCTDRRCKLPRVDGYVWMLDRAANDVLAKAKSLRLVK